MPAVELVEFKTKCNSVCKRVNEASHLFGERGMENVRDVVIVRLLAVALVIFWHVVGGFPLEILIPIAALSLLGMLIVPKLFGNEDEESN